MRSVAWERPSSLRWSSGTRFAGPEGCASFETRLTVGRSKCMLMLTISPAWLYVGDWAFLWHSWSCIHWWVITSVLCNTPHLLLCFLFNGLIFLETAFSMQSTSAALCVCSQLWFSTTSSCTLGLIPFLRLLLLAIPQLLFLLLVNLRKVLYFILKQLYVSF